MGNSGRAAHDKGEKDFKKSGGQANPNPLTELFHPTYAPPKGREKEYKAGWSNAKKQSK
jgi:hypothetical protein